MATEGGEARATALERLGSAFLALGPDPLADIAALTRLGAQVLGAGAAAYYRIDGARLFAIARCGVPDDFSTVVEADGALLAALRRAPDAVQRAAAPFAGFASCAARLVRVDGAEKGLLGFLYDADRRLASGDEGLIGLVAGAIALEERRLAAERERRRLDEALRQSMRMEAIGLLVGGIAHDFNNSLTNICGNAEILLKREGLSPEAREEIDEISRAGRYAASLTRQLLAFSRKSPVDPVVFDLNAVLADLHKMLKRTVGERVRVDLSPMEVPALVRADVGQIEQVVVNLAVNARDAMPDGGRLTIGTEFVAKAPTPPPPPLLGKAGGWVVLGVADTGVGISPQVRARLFEPFFTTKDPGKGTGLGLATVQGIVARNGGAVTVESEPGAGAEFRVWLPAAAAPAQAPARAPGDDVPLAGRRVLLVEDEAPVRAIVSRILRNAGMEVAESASGEEALAREGTPDVLITDVVMPGISGYELARRLRARSPELPVVFISGYADEETLRAASSAPNASVLMKPFAPSDLVRRVRRTLAAAVR